MSGFNLPKPLKMSGNLSENWKNFEQSLNIYLRASGQNNKSDDTKIAILLNCIGDDGLKTYNNFQFNGEETYVEVINKFKEVCNPKKNILFCRHKFYERSQKMDEPFDSFLIDVQTLARDCEFSDEKEIVRDRLVFGSADNETKQKIITSEKATLDEVIKLFKIAEMEKMQAISVCHTKYVDKIKKSSNSDKIKKSAPQENVNCRWCGKTHAKDKNKCPARGKKCSKCGLENHFASVCKTKVKKNVVKEINVENDYFCESVSNLKVINAISWYEKVEVENMLINFKLDTGSDVNLVPKNLFDVICHKSKRQININHNASVNLEAYNGTKIKVIGETYLNVIVKNVQSTVKFIIVDNNFTPILGLKTCIQFNLIRRADEIKKLNQKYLTKDDILGEYNDVFTGIGKFSKEYSIKMKKDAIPCSNPPHRVPLKIKDKLKDELRRLCDLDVMYKTEEPVEWVNNLVIVEKPDHSLRLCLDPKHLNNAIVKDYFEIPKIEDLAAKLKSSKYFSVLDLKDSFWQIPLDKVSSKYCTFSTPFGLYSFRRLPFGLNISAEVFQKYLTENFEDIQGVNIYIDDLLIYADTIEAHNDILKKVLDRARSLNIKFNKRKFQFLLREIKYLGHTFGHGEVKPDDEKIEAIKEYDVPNDKKSLQRFLGVVNYLRNFIPNLAEKTYPLRLLLKKNVEFVWEKSVHGNIFDELKMLICNTPVLKNFNPDSDIIIQTDSSKNAIGCVLIQDGHPVCFASKSLTDCEINYGQVDKEFLAILFALKKFHNYVYGKSVVVQTDHKPLVSLMNKDIWKIPSTRLQRIKLKISIYDIKVIFVPGNKMIIADAISRASSRAKVEETDESLNNVVHSVNVSNEIIEQIKQCTLIDPILCKIKNFCLNGWPKSMSKCEKEIKQFFQMKDLIYLENDLIFLDNKIVIPKSLTKMIIKVVHKTHFGIYKTTERIRSLFYWSKMNIEIKNFVENCEICKKFSNKNPKEPMLLEKPCDYPFQKVATDILDYAGEQYLVVVDYYSKWLDLVKIKFKDSKTLIGIFKQIFSIHGIPEILRADNMPFGSFEFQEFAKSWNFKIVTSSPYYPRGNAMAEKGVNIAKNLLKRSKQENVDIKLLLLEYRNTPVLNSKYSPSELLFSRKTRTTLPIHSNQLKQKIVPNFENVQNNKNRLNKKYYDKNSKPRNLNLQKGQKIYYQNDKIWLIGKFIKYGDTPRTIVFYDVNNKIKRRNSIHIKISNEHINLEKFESVCSFKPMENEKESIYFSNQRTIIPEEDENEEEAVVQNNEEIGERGEIETNDSVKQDSDVQNKQDYQTKDCESDDGRNEQDCESDEGQDEQDYQTANEQDSDHGQNEHSVRVKKKPAYLKDYIL